jgi:UDP-N-acetylglucosamine diphosphorylase/glucosamine-1-phosphate N-acetyltransferase
VVLDTRKGPIFLDRDVVVQAFTRIEGPCYLGPGTQVFGAKIKGSSIGPMCRVGGEIEASIMHAYSNKYHDGFLGHSYVGEWVNLAAGTQTSDLRNDYGPVPVTINRRRINTGQTKVGAFIGDHTKTALGTLLNTGTVVGAFSGLLPDGGLLPKVVPSFCTVWNGQVREVSDIEPLLKTAAVVMQRRDREFTEADAAYFRRLYQETAAQRQEVVQGSAPSRLRAGA